MTPERITQLATSAMARYVIQQASRDDAIGHIKDAIITAINETKREDAKLCEEIAWRHAIRTEDSDKMVDAILASKIKE